MMERPGMSTHAIIDGVRCKLEQMDSGSIRVTHDSTQVNAMNGPGTAGEITYIVHPAQRNQYEFLVGLLPQIKDGSPKPPSDVRPWWSYVGGAKEKRERGDTE